MKKPTKNQWVIGMAIIFLAASWFPVAFMLGEHTKRINELEAEVRLAREGAAACMLQHQMKYME